MVLDDGAVRVAVAQLAAEPFQSVSNAARGASAIRDAAAQGADLVVLPELLSTGYVLDRSRVHAAAEAVDDVAAGPCLDAWTTAAREEQVAVVAGLAERAREGCYNSAVVISDDGSVQGVYRKLHLFGAERDVFEPGDRGLPIFELKGLRVGVLVCYDLRFPEVLRILASLGADLVVVPIAWVEGFDQAPTPSPGMIHQVVNAVVQANLNQVWVAAAGRTGRDEGVELLGSSVIIDPYGRVVAGPVPRDEETLTFADVRPNIAAETRRREKQIDPREDRRTDVYDPLLGYRDPKDAALTSTQGRIRPVHDD